MNVQTGDVVRKSRWALDVIIHRIQDKITHQGQNDSFFAGEEMIDQEEINPNVSMGYQKFRFDPNPEFIE